MRNSALNQENAAGENENKDENGDDGVCLVEQVVFLLAVNFIIEGGDLVLLCRLWANCQHKGITAALAHLGLRKDNSFFVNRDLVVKAN